MIGLGGALFARFLKVRSVRLIMLVIVHIAGRSTMLVDLRIPLRQVQMLHLELQLVANYRYDWSLCQYSFQIVLISFFYVSLDKSPFVDCAE